MKLISFTTTRHNVPVLLGLLLFNMSCNNKSTEQSEKGLLMTSFAERSIEEINTYLTQTSETLSPTDIMKRYYPKEPLQTNEGNETISLTSDGSAISTTTVTLIHDNLLDRSVKAYRYEMRLKQVNDYWQVISIDKTWKCWRDPADNDWKTETCA